MVYGQVSELIHKIIPAHPESEDRSVSCFLYLMSYRFLRALQKCLKRYRFIYRPLLRYSHYSCLLGTQQPSCLLPPFLLAKEGSIREVA